MGLGQLTRRSLPELKISPDNAQHILKLVNEPYSNLQITGDATLDRSRNQASQASAFLTTQSAFALLEKRVIHDSRVLGLDTMLEGGLRSGQLLEIAGPPGSGKATIALEFLRVALNKNRSVLVIGECHT
jgi:RecA/RadA recombinase